MVYITCYYYIIEIEIDYIDENYCLKPTQLKYNGEIIYELFEKKNIYIDKWRFIPQIIWHLLV